MPVSYYVGQYVKLSSTGEVGVMVCIWIDPVTEAEDAYIAFFGEELPKGRPIEKPYILRYFTSSLQPMISQE